MSRKAKQFGISKQSKRRQKRKKRVAADEPSALVPRSRAAVVYHLFENRQDDVVEVSPAIRHLVS